MGDLKARRESASEEREATVGWEEKAVRAREKTRKKCGINSIV